MSGHTVALGCEEYRERGIMPSIKNNLVGHGPGSIS